MLRLSATGRTGMPVAAEAAWRNWNLSIRRTFGLQERRTIRTISDSRFRPDLGHPIVGCVELQNLDHVGRVAYVCECFSELIKC